jgi:hypothetical protein
VQYLLLRARRIRIFGGLEIQTDAGWDEIKRGLRAVAQGLFAAPPADVPNPSRNDSRK